MDPPSLFEGFSGSDGAAAKGRVDALISYVVIPALSVLALLKCLLGEGLIGEKGEPFSKSVPRIIGHLFAGFNFHFGQNLTPPLIMLSVTFIFGFVLQGASIKETIFPLSGLTLSASSGGDSTSSNGS
jgi:hypothetical protein